MDDGYGRGGGERTVLMVAEKPMLADAISKALSQGAAVRRGGRGELPVYEYKGQFHGEPAKFKFTCTTGHVFSIDFTDQYQDWQTTDEESLFFEADTWKKPCPGGVPSHLREESRGCTDVVLWLDCDREGENICFEVLSIVMGNIRHRENVWRAKFSAITPQELGKAFSNLGRPDQNVSDSVDARQVLDLRVGVAFSRFQTKYFQGKFTDLDASVVSYGPCQTPTLGFCVDRHDLIENHQPEAFWKLIPHVQKLGRVVQFEWERERVFDYNAAQLLYSYCNTNRTKVVSVESKVEVKPRPGALNTVEMLKVASKKLGMSPFHTMKVAEGLYQAGFISYPRTESTAYPSSFDFKGPLHEQRHSPHWGEHVTELLQRGLTRPRGGKDMGDHPPITPMRYAEPGHMHGHDWRLYEHITRHYIATLSPDMHFTRTKVVIRLGFETFTAVGRVQDPDEFSWVNVLPHFKIEDEALPDIQQGETLDIVRLELFEGETKPPNYLTESELIGMMEKNGIGTDASIPTHIQNIQKRYYVEEGPGRTMVPTDLGVLLVHGYHKIDAQLVLPMVRQSVEEEVTRIAEGKCAKDDVVEWSLRIFRAKFRYFKENIERMAGQMECRYEPVSKTGTNISRCGVCRRYMKYIDSRPQYLECPNCDEKYNLPQNGCIKLFMGKTCPLDGFELLLFKVDAPGKEEGKSYPLCPQCWNDPPLEDIGGKTTTMNCLQCTHPDCEHSNAANVVTQCPDCGGDLCLDPDTTQKRMRMVCSSPACSLIVQLPRDCESAKVVAARPCAECGSNTVEFVFHRGETRKRGCVLCDEFINRSLTEMRVRIMNAKGKGKGRTKGGKGKGRKGGKGKGR